jgi:predicted RNA-binding Zn-ribbon protein involved in translation (DUF1610 family)
MNVNKRYIVWIILAAVVVWMGWEARHNTGSANKHLMVQICIFAGAAVYDRIAIRREQKREEVLARNLCRRCGQSLNGVTTGACPKCGQSFQWSCPQCKEPVVADSTKCDKCGCVWDP